MSQILFFSYYKRGDNIEAFFGMTQTLFIYDMIYNFYF